MPSQYLSRSCKGCTTTGINSGPQNVLTNKRCECHVTLVLTLRTETTKRCMEVLYALVSTRLTAHVFSRHTRS